jgi:hypothetical protein
MFQKKAKKVQKELPTSTRLLRCVEFGLAGFLELDFCAQLQHHFYLRKKRNMNIKIRTLKNAIERNYKK